MSKFLVLSVLIGLFCQVTIGLLTEDDLDDTDRHCIKKLNYDTKVILDSFDKDNFIVGNPEVYKFVECGWKRDKLVSDEGSFNIDNIKKMIEFLLETKMNIKNPDKRNALSGDSLNHCKDIKGDHVGEKIVNMFNCLLKYVMEHLED
ncbi:hypothetical protein RI129_009804 [Pyrocoelia pectoralis]|uniref:Uncharacterized protein n=1 Tax=Pyrocoelia pectoralis TaxID=417401 RepID=A0AAN7ZG86_9COLE